MLQVRNLRVKMNMYCVKKKPEYTAQSLINALVVILVGTVNSGHFAVGIVWDVATPSCDRHCAGYPSFSFPSL